MDGTCRPAGPLRPHVARRRARLGHVISHARWPSPHLLTAHSSRLLTTLPPQRSGTLKRSRGTQHATRLLQTSKQARRGSRFCLGFICRRRHEHGRAAGAAVHGGAERGRHAPGHHPRRHLRVHRHRHLRLRRRGVRPLAREDVPRHEHGGRAGGRGAGARAGTGRRGGRGRQHLGRAREPSHHLRRAPRRPHLARPRGLLLGRAAAGRRGRHAPPPSRHGRRPPARVRARVRCRRLARRAAGGRHDVRPHVRLLRHGDRPEAGPRGHHRAAGRGVPARRQRAGGRGLRRRRDEPGAGLRPGARRVAVEAPLGVLARPLPRRWAGRAGVRVPGHPVLRRRRRDAHYASPAARAGGLLAS